MAVAHGSEQTVGRSGHRSAHSASGTVMGDSCCGASLQEIVLSTGGPSGPGVVLQRCSRCGARQYTCGGRLLEPSDAFEALAGTFRRQDRPGRAGLDRRAVGATVRAAQSAQAASASAQRAADRAAARAAAQAAGEAARSAQTTPDTVDVTDLTDLLAGWTVLGATR